ncbi:GFA family protein [Janthinobacterium sp. MDT1-19]|uniref:GFA family protein n=1 Tax=Janthinobacterium sp. MDT1-19 TaxID=1259339 RepID=UPI003F28F6E9
MEKVVQTGGCLCGAVRFEVTGDGSNPHSCSCRNCQQHTGAPTVAWMEFARDQVRWTGTVGAPATYRSSDYSSRAFCAACGSSIGAIDDAPTVALLAGSFLILPRPPLRPNTTRLKIASRTGGWSPLPLLMRGLWFAAALTPRNEKSTPKRARAD